MAEGRNRQAWEHTSWLLAMIANMHRDPKKSRPLRPADFNPYVPGRGRRSGIRLTTDNLHLLKALVPAGAATKEI